MVKTFGITTTNCLNINLLMTLQFPPLYCCEITITTLNSSHMLSKALSTSVVLPPNITSGRILLHEQLLWLFSFPLFTAVKSQSPQVVESSFMNSSHMTFQFPLLYCCEIKITTLNSSHMLSKALSISIVLPPNITSGRILLHEQLSYVSKALLTSVVLPPNITTGQILLQEQPLHAIQGTPSSVVLPPNITGGQILLHE